jgi:hypothetical protein
MNEYLLLTLIERLLSLYDAQAITQQPSAFTNEFKSLIGKMQDAVSQVD